MSAWARVGVKCVCIKGWSHPSSKHSIVTNQVYTIASIPHKAFNEVYVSVAEVYNLDGDGPYWKLSSFRPLVTRTQDEDVALFTHHLDKVGEPV